MNDFVLTHDTLDDHDPPQWTSTYNDHQQYPAVAPTPRVGIQQAVVADGKVTVRWDVAMDENRVQYVLYAQSQPFDFTGGPGAVGGDPDGADAHRPQGLPGGRGPRQLPVRGCRSPAFPQGQIQYLLIRAVDQSPNANEDTNTVVLSVTP